MEDSTARSFSSELERPNFPQRCNSFLEGRVLYHRGGPFFFVEIVSFAPPRLPRSRDLNLPPSGIELIAGGKERSERGGNSLKLRM